MGSGAGLPGRSHSSCQALRSWRAGLPVLVGERSVSELVACRNQRDAARTEQAGQSLPGDLALAGDLVRHGCCVRRHHALPHGLN